jgi:HlyD family secretion protein
MNVSDLSTMEVNVEVNESDIVRIQLGDEAEIEVDAYLGTTFTGRVTEIGNTALNAIANGFNMDQVTNFSVKVRIDQESYAQLSEGKGENYTPFRPGMSATVDILTARRVDALSAPIQAVTMRELGFATKSDEDGMDGTQERTELGVFVLEDGNAVWTPVETDIQDSRHVVLSGETLQEGTSIITGPYETVSRTLEHGESVESVESD